MSYNNNIPLAADKLSVSQSDLLNNMMAIESLVEVDHVDFNAPGQGKHQRVSLVQNTPNPPPFDAGDVGLYGFYSPVSLQNEMFISSVKQSGPPQQVNATGSILSTNFSPGTNSNGWTYLPSGILIKWGKVTVVSTSITPAFSYSFPGGAGTPAFNTVFSMQLSICDFAAINDTNKSVILAGFQASGFAAIATVRYNSSTYTTVDCNYLAIGR
jgi:hypothetical protein